jgi:hypothetical protein
MVLIRGSGVNAAMGEKGVIEGERYECGKGLGTGSEGAKNRMPRHDLVYGQW